MIAIGTDRNQTSLHLQSLLILELQLIIRYMISYVYQLERSPGINFLGLMRAINLSHHTQLLYAR